MNDFTLTGFWKFKSNRIRQENGDWLTEKLTGGTMAFSERGDAVLLVSSEQGPWGYVGKYSFNQNTVLIKIETSTAEDLAGETIERTVKVMNPNEFIFTGLEAHTGRTFETHFVRV